MTSTKDLITGHKRLLKKAIDHAERNTAGLENALDHESNMDEIGTHDQIDRASDNVKDRMEILDDSLDSIKYFKDEIAKLEASNDKENGHYKTESVDKHMKRMGTNSKSVYKRIKLQKGK